MSEQNCWSQVSVQPSGNCFGFISITVSPGLVINLCFLCVIRFLKVFHVSFKYCFVPQESHISGPRVFCCLAAIRKEKQLWKLFFFPDKSTIISMDSMAGINSWGCVSWDEGLWNTFRGLVWGWFFLAEMWARKEQKLGQPGGMRLGRLGKQVKKEDRFLQKLSILNKAANLVGFCYQCLGRLIWMLSRENIWPCVVSTVHVLACVLFVSTPCITRGEKQMFGGTWLISSQFS